MYNSSDDLKVRVLQVMYVQTMSRSSTALANDLAILAARQKLIGSVPPAMAAFPVAAYIIADQYRKRFGVVDELENGVAIALGSDKDGGKAIVVYRERLLALILR